MFRAIDADPGSRLGRGRRLPAVELRLPQLPRASAPASIRATPRTQESVAISADGDDWFLLNASPEIRQQIESFPPLHPRRRPPLARSRHLPDQRRPRSLPGPALAARVASARGLRDRAGVPRLQRGQRAVPDAPAVRGPGDLATPQGRPRGRGARARRPAERPPGRAGAGARQAADPPRGPPAARPRGRNRPPDPRGAHRPRARVLLGRRRR